MQFINLLNGHEPEMCSITRLPFSYRLIGSFPLISKPKWALNSVCRSEIFIFWFRSWDDAKPKGAICFSDLLLHHEQRNAGLLPQPLGSSGQRHRQRAIHHNREAAGNLEAGPLGRLHLRKRAWGSLRTLIETGLALSHGLHSTDQ